MMKGIDMDPTACMREIIWQLQSGNKTDARMHIHNLIDWLRKGGFEPKLSTGLWLALMETLEETLKPCTCYDA